jgi:dihydrofolate reductase/enamine deaminase RidA (YjgF/YER057c/UK114 family)
MNRLVPPLLVAFLLLQGCSSLGAESQRICFHQSEAIEKDIGFCRAVRFGNTLYVSGTVGEGSMDAAVRSAYADIEQTLAANGLSFANVVKETVFATDLDAFIRSKGIRKEFYGQSHPAATWVQVELLYLPSPSISFERTQYSSSDVGPLGCHTPDFLHDLRLTQLKERNVMSRLKLQMQITVDGFNPDGQNGGLSWDEVRDYSRDLLASANTIVIGRKTAADFIPHWEKVAAKPDDSWYDVAQRIANAKKIVFSKTLNGSHWRNTDIEKGNLVEGIEQLKSTNTKDIIVYGGISFVSSFVKAGLIDEFHLFINPVALGKGRSIFGGLENSLPLTLIKSISCNSGHVLLHYELR